MTKELLTRKESTRYPGLFVKKYTRKVFYDNLWHENDELLEARGHVELADGRVVVRPFTKIFNRGENGTDIDLDEYVLAIRKVNGFMACATYVPEVGEVVVSTTGSLDSDFVKMAEEYITPAIKCAIIEEYNLWYRGTDTTWMFEIVHPDDPHIIKENCGAYLIGCRAVNFDTDTPYTTSETVESYLDHIAKNVFGVYRPEWKVCKFSEIVEDAKTCKHEGFVVYGKDTALKIKGPYYLCLKAAARKKDIMSLNKQIVDEEFYPLIKHLTENQESFNMLNEQERLDYMRKFLEK
jgi:hypothetical protein